MKYQLLFENFIEVVRNTIPQNTKISAVLADILQIEKEAIYRRLRMEVPFTFTEISTIAQHLGISLDNIIGTIPSKSRPLQMTLIEYVEPFEIDYMMMENYINMLVQIRKMPYSEMGASCNVLPQALYLKFEHITRFYLFKWMYLYGNAHNVKSFSDIVIPERLRKLQVSHMTEFREIKNSSYIWDKMIFHYLVEDIKHFAGIHLISPQEVQILKEDILRFIDDVEKLACNGYYSETGNKLNIYISNINFETSYTYFEAQNYTLSMVSAFSLNAISTQDDKTFEKVKNWMQSLKRVSTLISESGEKQRVMFFQQQREITNRL